MSVALMSAIVASLSAVTGQWLPNWHRGFGRVQRLESLDVGMGCPKPRLPLGGGHGLVPQWLTPCHCLRFHSVT